MTQVAALFVDQRGVYAGLVGVDAWGEERDARLYAGPAPVVAHPPCARWCRLAGFVESRGGRRRGDHAGCFASALASVRRWGGVLEHPAHSKAWEAHGLLPPPTGGGWVTAGLGSAGWTCYVEQARYGHKIRKGTWLFACGTDLPELRWGFTRGDMLGEYSWAGGRSQHGRPRLPASERARTPPEFRDVLLAMARSAR